MDTPVKHFTDACGDYADCVELLKAVFKVAKKNAEELAEEMDENAFLAKFDVSLQAFLLKIAVADQIRLSSGILFRRAAIIADRSRKLLLLHIRL